MSEIPKPTFAPYQSLFYGYGINYPRCKEDCYWYAEEQDMNARIPYCECKNKFPIDPEDCKHCELYHSKNKMTNADRIRAMTDEELSSWISDHVDCNRRCEAWKDGCMDSDSTCMEVWLEWLKEEVATVIPADNQGGDA